MDNEKIIIRKGKISDTEDLIQILRDVPELQGIEGEGIYTKDFVTGALKNKDRDLILIAEKDSKIAGLLMAELWKHKKFSFITDIFIKPELRKQGIASRLFSKYENICKKDNMNIINLLVLTKNRRMQKWCRKHGFIRGNKMYYYEKKLI